MPLLDADAAQSIYTKLSHAAPAALAEAHD